MSKLSYKQGVNPKVRAKVQKHSVLVDLDDDIGDDDGDDYDDDDGVYFIELCGFEDICDNSFLPDAFVEEGLGDEPDGT